MGEFAEHLKRRLTEEGFISESAVAPLAQEYPELETEKAIEAAYVALAGVMRKFVESPDTLFEAYEGESGDAKVLKVMFDNIKNDIVRVRELISKVKGKVAYVGKLIGYYCEDVDNKFGGCNKGIAWLVKNCKWIDEDGQKYKTLYQEITELVKSFYTMIITTYGVAHTRMIPKTVNVLGELPYAQAEKESDTKQILTQEQWSKGFLSGAEKEDPKSELQESFGDKLKRKLQEEGLLTVKEERSSESDMESIYNNLNKALFAFNKLGEDVLLESLLETEIDVGQSFKEIDEYIQKTKILIKGMGYKEPIVIERLTTWLEKVDLDVAQCNATIKLLAENNKWIDEEGQLYKTKYAVLMDLVKSFYNVVISSTTNANESIIPKTKNVLGNLLHSNAKAETKTSPPFLTQDQWNKGFLNNSLKENVNRFWDKLKRKLQEEGLLTVKEDQSSENNMENIYSNLNKAFLAFNKLGMDIIAEAFSPGGMYIAESSIEDSFKEIDSHIALTKTAIKAAKVKHDLVSNDPDFWIKAIDAKVLSSNQIIDKLVKDNKWIDEDGKKFKTKYQELMDLTKAFYNVMVMSYSNVEDKDIPKTVNVFGELLHPNAAYPTKTEKLLTLDQWNKGFLDNSANKENPLSEQSTMYQEDVIRQGKRVKLWKTTREGFRIEYDSHGNPHEVEIKPKEQMNRELGQVTGQDKRNGMMGELQRRREMSMAKRPALEPISGKIDPEANESKELNVLDFMCEAVDPEKERERLLRIYHSTEPYSKENVKAIEDLKALDKKFPKQAKTEKKEAKKEYIGSCVEVGTSKGKHLPWKDATELSNDLGYWSRMSDDDGEKEDSNYVQISVREFEKNAVLNRPVNGNCKFLKKKDGSIFVIYDAVKDIHYFYN